MADAIPDSWHNFFSLAGSATATLVGLMFVAASVGTGVFTEERQAGLRLFLSPTVVAFSVVVATSIVGVLPLPAGGVPAVLFGGIGGLGVAYSVTIWRRMLSNGLAAKIDLEDRFWYLAAPTLAYLVLAGAGFAFAVGGEFADVILAAGIGALLVTGVRNAWDMTTWVVVRRRD